MIMITYMYYTDFLLLLPVTCTLCTCTVGYKVIKEIERVTKKCVYILNIRNKTHEVKQSKHRYDGDFQHIIYEREAFEMLGYSVCDATYEKDKKFSVPLVDTCFVVRRNEESVNNLFKNIFDTLKEKGLKRDQNVLSYVADKLSFPIEKINYSLELPSS